MILPFNTTHYDFDNYFVAQKDNYVHTFNAFSMDWFDIYTDDETDIFENCKWSDCTRNQTMYNGIMYDFSNIQDEYGNTINIDKFANIVKVNFINN